MQTGTLKKTKWGDGGIVTTAPLLWYKDDPEYVIPITKLPFLTREFRTYQIKKRIEYVSNILEAEKLLKYYGDTDINIKKMWDEIQWILLNLFPCSCEMPYRPLLGQPAWLDKITKWLCPPPRKKPLNIFDKWYNWGKALLPDDTEFNPYLKGR